MPYLANVDVRWGQFDLSDLREMPFEESEKERYGLRFGDIVMCEGGEPGRCAVWKDERPGMMFQKALFRIRPHQELLPEFLYYYFVDTGRRNAFSPFFTGSTIKHLPREKLSLVEVPLPPLSEQRRIVGILSAYDDLIENNRKRIALLEESARRLYKEWFVRLRFPGHERVPVEDGVPKGWKRTTLGEACETNRRSYSVSELPPSINYIDISSVSEGRILGKTAMLAKEAPGRARRKAQSGDVIWSNVRPNLKAYALVLDPEPNDVFSTGFTILTPTTIPFSFLYLFVSTDGFVSYLENMVTGATYPAVRPSDFEQATFLLPDSETLHLFHDFVSPLFLQCKNLEHQSRTLAAARDALLPRLMKNG